MRIGPTSTICLLSISAAYAAAFVACGGDTGSGDSTSGGTITTNTTNTTSTTIVITGVGGAGGAGTTTGGTGGSGGSGGTVVIDGDAACVAEPRAGEQIPLDLFFMVDKSGSMGCAVGPAGMNCTSPPANNPPAVNRWTSIKEALVAFASSPASNGLGMGMGFFPQYSNPNGTGTLRCTPQDYSTPAAPIAMLNASAGAIQMALDAQTSNGNTPTVPALSGAIQYATSYAQTHPGRTVGVVFASDGEPTECRQNNNDIPGAVRVAQAAAMGMPPIRTYVLGVGPSLNNLNQIAVAGGTQKAYLVESGGSADLITALNDIRKSALTCDYQIPMIAGRPLDLNLVNIMVRVGPPPSNEQQLGRVDSLAACGAKGGWYFDNPAAPTRIQLCPTTCDPLLKTTGSGLTVLIGCRVVIQPPN
jgi:hypothetical protein